MTQQINLFDPALQRRREWLTLGSVAGLALVLAVAVGALGHFEQTRLAPLTAQSAANEIRLKAARDQIAALGQKAAARKPDPHLAQELANRRFMLETSNEVLAILRKSVGTESGPPFAEYLRGLARQTVSGLWLMAFSIDARSGAMEIRGRTVDPALLPEYIRRLNNEPAFQGRAFSALKLDVGKPPAPASAAAPASAPAPLARYHEFTLAPLQAAAVAQLTDNPAAASVAGKAG